MHVSHTPSGVFVPQPEPALHASPGAQPGPAPPSVPGGEVAAPASGAPVSQGAHTSVP
jgi:hypothetical protein